MKKIQYIALIFFLFSCNSYEKQTLIVASASSTRPVLEKIISLFSSEFNVEVQLITASSGKLSNQINNGAPFDIFISANRKYPEFLKEKNHSFQPITTLAYGKLAVATLEDIKYPNSFFRKNNFSKLGIANPKIAPYGIATLEFLKNTKVYDSIHSKLIYGESVTQVNQFLMSESVSTIITAYSSIKNTVIEERYKIRLLDSLNYQLIENTVLGLNEKNNTLKFVSYLKSKKISKLLQSYGYKVN